MPVQPPKYITRFRVRNASKAWNDQGPDLLRPRTQARRQVVGAIHDVNRAMWVQRNAGEWGKIGSREKVLDTFDEWEGLEFRVGLMNRGTNRVEYFCVVKRERVPYIILSHSSPDTSLNWSLSHFQFPDAKFAGGYVYKQVSGSDSWSDHAWGTAYDQTQNGKDTIERITDWSARMARANCMEFDYALGSLDGKNVVYIDGDSGETRPSSASDSHLWHKHESTRDHDGRKPPHEGGVW